MLSARSSTAKKFSLIVANGVGIIDQDYCGDNDEIGLSVLNFTGTPVHIAKGDRVGQATLVSITKADEFKVVPKMDSRDRGGWGSTGH
jgi:dUTP pyrophosphatase